MRAFDKAWQILKEESVGEKYGLPPGFSGNPEMYNRAREERSYNNAIDHQAALGESQALENVGEAPSFQELVAKLISGEELTMEERMILTRSS